MLIGQNTTLVNDCGTQTGFAKLITKKDIIQRIIKQNTDKLMEISQEKGKLARDVSDSYKNKSNIYDEINNKHTPKEIELYEAEMNKMREEMEKAIDTDNSAMG